MARRNIKVSVVIPAYTLDRLDDIKDAVRSVRVQTFKPTEIIIAIDHNGELLDRLIGEVNGGIKMVLNEHIKGSAETRNAGIRSASGDVVVFIDDDAMARRDWLEKIVQHYQEPNVVAVGGKIISVWEEGRPNWFPEELDWIVGGTYKGFTEAQQEVRNLLWPNMSFRREICGLIGYVRTDMGALGNRARAGDEMEFCMRIRKLVPDARIIYEPEAVVYHKANQTTFGYLAKRSYSDGRCKSVASKVFNELADRAFSTETGYLRYLLLKAIPERLGRFYKQGNLAQAVAMLVSIGAFGVGYLRGRIRID